MTTLQSIIPPILAILSVIGIIIFLVKKTPAIEQLERKDQKERTKEVQVVFGPKKDSEIFEKIKHGFLIGLEKFVKKSRILFLKLENLLKFWGEEIRKKRHAKTADESVKEQVQPVIKKDEPVDGIVTERYAEKKKIRERLGLNRKTRNEDLENKFFRPIISDNIVVPKRRREVKNRLEELLIERIAINPKDIEAYERLGEYYLEINNIEHSKECFEQVARLNPKNKNVAYKINRLERMLKK